MAYSRLGPGSDLYLIGSIIEGKNCYICYCLDNSDSTVCYSKQDIIDHIGQHIKSGYSIDDKVIIRIKEDNWTD